MVTFDWYKEHAEQLWCGCFAMWRVTDKNGTRRNWCGREPWFAHRLYLTDQMDDRFYDYPLTIKVRLPELERCQSRATDEGSAGKNR